MSGSDGAPGPKGQKSLTGFGFSIASGSSSKRKNDRASDLEVEVVPEKVARCDVSPLSDSKLAKFKNPFPYAVYHGVHTGKDGKPFHAFSCSICDDGQLLKWASPYDAGRHALQSVRHQRKVSDRSLVKSMQKSQSRMRQAATEQLLSASSKILAIAAYMVAENVAWRQFPKVSPHNHMKLYLDRIFWIVGAPGSVAAINDTCNDNYANSIPYADPQALRRNQ
jgi:hypothetical protein